MDIKDLAGLEHVSEFASKLIETISKGTGRLFKSYFQQQDTSNSAKAIEAISEAAQRAAERGVDVNYDDGQLSLSAKGLTDEELAERSRLREQYTIAREQINIERITAYAADEVRENPDNPISPEAVDDDWIARFFDTGKHVSSDHMARLWGKILAGEVAQPGSYSLRTLDVLRNLSQKEAKSFNKIAKYAMIGAGGDAFALYAGYSPDTMRPAAGFAPDVVRNYGLKYGDMIQLIESGLLTSPLTHGYQLAPNSQWLCSYGNKGVFCIVGKIAVSIPVAIFTQAGRELLALVKPELDLSYLYRLAAYLDRNSVSVHIGSRLGDHSDPVVLVSKEEIQEHLASFGLKPMDYF
jgi:uncharacterized repeat protein (TIGR03899 family)